MADSNEALEFDNIFKQLADSGQKAVFIMNPVTDHMNLTRSLQIMDSKDLIKIEATTGLGQVAYMREKGWEAWNNGEGWGKFLLKEEEKKKLLSDKQKEQEERETKTHEKTLLDIEKLQRDSKTYELQTEVLKKQDIKLAADIGKVGDETKLIKGQIRSINRQNIFFWITAIATIVGIIVGIYQVINIRSQLRELQSKPPIETPQPKTNTNKGVSNQIQPADSASEKK